MYLNPKLFALQVAVLSVMLKHNPELKEEIEKTAEFYKETFFYSGADAFDAVGGALDHMLSSLE